jgi:Flp pilus assembly protein CpaB
VIAMTNPAIMSADDIVFGSTVTLDPQAFVVVSHADLSGGDWIVVEPVRWRDWNDDTVALDVVWSTASKPDKTED